MILIMCNSINNYGTFPDCNNNLNDKGPSCGNCDTILQRIRKSGGRSLHSLNESLYTRRSCRHVYHTTCISPSRPCPKCEGVKAEPSPDGAVMKNYHASAAVMTTARKTYWIMGLTLVIGTTALFFALCFLIPAFPGFLVVVVLAAGMISLAIGDKCSFRCF
jgi:hypothetical protein